MYAAVLDILSQTKLSPAEGFISDDYETIRIISTFPLHIYVFLWQIAICILKNSFPLLCLILYIY